MLEVANCVPDCRHHCGPDRMNRLSLTGRISWNYTVFRALVNPFEPMGRCAIIAKSLHLWRIRYFSLRVSPCDAYFASLLAAPFPADWRQPFDLQLIRSCRVAAMNPNPEVDFHTYENPVTQYWATICLPAAMNMEARGLWRFQQSEYTDRPPKKPYSRSTVEVAMRNRPTVWRQQKKTRLRLAAGFQ